MFSSSTTALRTLDTLPSPVISGRHDSGSRRLQQLIPRSLQSSLSTDQRTVCCSSTHSYMTGVVPFSLLCQPCGRPCDVIRPTLTNERLMTSQGRPQGRHSKLNGTGPGLLTRAPVSSVIQLVSRQPPSPPRQRARTGTPGHHPLHVFIFSFTQYIVHNSNIHTRS